MQAQAIVSNAVIDTSSRHFRVSFFFFFPISPNGDPPGSKCFGLRRLLTHRCYSNAGRKSWPNITFDLACQLIRHHLF